MYLSFNDARNITRKLGLKNKKDWDSWIKGKTKLYKIPSNPNTYYKDQWISLSDWIDSDTQSFNNREYHDYDYCVLLFKNKRLKNRNDFYQYMKTNTDEKIPNRPDHVYKKSGKWINWQSFLSIKWISPVQKSNFFMTYDDAKKFVIGLKLTQQSEYINYIEDNNVVFLPKRPDYVYRSDWTGYLDFLGCETNRKSFGERKIKEFLDNENITYIREKKFETYINVKELPFDFYLPDYNICIEYDGELHYRCSDMFGGQKSLDRIKINDKIKSDWCIDNNTRLIRIPYKKKNKIFQILKLELLNF